MSYEIDTKLFRYLDEKNPVEVCKRALCHYDDEGRHYVLTYWGDEYAINPSLNLVDRLSDNLPKPHEYFPVFAVNYLMQIQKRPLTYEWISEKDIPGGAVFFRGPHEIPTGQLPADFRYDKNAFCKACEQLQGTSLELADAAYAFNVTPRLAVAVLYWDGDDDFPSECKMLFDSSIAGSLALDTVFALAVDVCSRLYRIAVSSNSVS